MSPKPLVKRSSKQWRSPLPSFSLASSSLSKKTTAVLQSAQCTIECSSADRKFVLQPNHLSGPLNGLFVDDDAKRGSPDKEEENKVRLLIYANTEEVRC